MCTVKRFHLRRSAVSPDIGVQGTYQVDGLTRLAIVLSDGFRVIEDTVTSRKTPGFRPSAATELAAHLLNGLGGKADWLTVLKLMYRVERRALERYGWPVVFDDIYLLPQGPVLQSVYDLLKGETHNDEWSKYIKSVKPKANLARTPRVWHLSQAQVELAREELNENDGKTGYQLSQDSHNLPEWNDPRGSSQKLEYEELLRYLGKSEAEIEKIFERLASEAEVEELLGDYRR